jgi:Uma2 family endonuclease
MVIALDRPSSNIWQTAQWEDYLTERDRPYDELHKQKIYYHQNQLFLEMGAEGIDHAAVNNLFNLLIGFWLSFHPEILAHMIGGCQLEQPSGNIAAAPDIVLYLGENRPKRKKGDRRYLNLDEWGVPALVGEISDTTIIHDLDEKKHIYANLGIPEYWVIDIQAQRVFLFALNTETNSYQVSETSQILPGLTSELLVTALKRLEQEGNTQVAQWFAQQLQQPSSQPSTL